MKRRLDMESGRATLEPGRWQDVLEFDGRILSTVHGPRWRLLIIGAGELSRLLGQMAVAMDYRVTVCDPREEYRAGWSMRTSSPGTVTPAYGRAGTESSRSVGSRSTSRVSTPTRSTRASTS